MKKILFTIGWGLLAFVIAQMVMAFISGMLFYTLAASKIEAEQLPRYIALTGAVIATIVAVAFVVMGARGRLPGTKAPTRRVVSVDTKSLPGKSE